MFCWICTRIYFCRHLPCQQLSTQSKVTKATKALFRHSRFVAVWLRYAARAYVLLCTGKSNFVAVPRRKKLADRFRRRRWVRAMQCMQTREEQQQVRYSSSCWASDDEGGNRMRRCMLTFDICGNPLYCLSYQFPTTKVLAC